MIKAVFVDIDNTILSFDEYVKDAMREGFEKFGLPKYEDGMFDVFVRINSGLWLDHEKGLMTFEEILKVRWNLIFKELGFSGDGPAFEDYFRLRLWDSGILEPKAKEFLEYLWSKYPLYIASNGPYGQQRNRLKVSGLEDFFNDYYVSEDVGYPKPNRGFFEEAFRRMNEALTEKEKIMPEDTIIIGDSLTSDMAGGRSFGMKTMLYNRSGNISLEKAGVDYIINSLDEVSKYL